MRSLALVCLALLGCSPASQNLVVTADRSSATANGTDVVTITATRTTATGSPVQDFVDFTVSAGGQLSAAHVKGDASGAAITTLTATTAGAITVTATATDSASVTGSATVTFTAASAPHLRFQTSPGNTVAGNLLRPVPVVAVEDGAGVVSSSSASITVAITPGSCAGVALDSTSLMTVAADHGLASFYGLKVGTAATGCTLTATSGSLPSAVSTAFDIQ